MTAAQPSGVVQVAQHADDLDRATEFYTLTLGLPLIARFGPLVFVDLGGTRLLLEQAAPPAMIYLRVADLQGRVRRLRDAGVDVVAEPQFRIEGRPAQAWTSSALTIWMSSTGTSSWKPLRPVLTPPSSSTTDWPSTTLPNTA